MMEVLRRQELDASGWKNLADIWRLRQKMWIFALCWFREGFHVDVLYLEIAGPSVQSANYWIEPGLMRKTCTGL